MQLTSNYSLLFAATVIQQLSCIQSFVVIPKQQQQQNRQQATFVSTTATTTTTTSLSSFVADGSDYSNKKGDFESGQEETQQQYSNKKNEYQSDIEEDDVDTVELGPVPMSKNSGNRFLAVFF